MPIQKSGWELLITRLREDKRNAKRRTVGQYQVFHDGKAVLGLAGMCAETRGPGDNSRAGNHKRIEAGRYPLRTQGGRKYVTYGYQHSTSVAKIPRPGIAVDHTNKRTAILIHPGRGFLSSIGCINPAKSLAGSRADINFVDSRKRLIAIIEDMKAFIGDAFPARNGRPIPNAALVIDGEPSPAAPGLRIGLPMAAMQARMAIRADQLDEITEMAGASTLARTRWRDRGMAPPGYIKGMALVYGRVYAKYKAGDAAARDMARKNTSDREHDALAWYEDIFDAAGMDNSRNGVDTLRHLFVLLIGLGMRETSGVYCEGRDRSAHNTTASSAEAGLFQTSFNAKRASPLLPKIFAHYKANPSGFLDVFKEAKRGKLQHCSAANLRNYGIGAGREFQRLSKACPAFAAEFAAVGLRHLSQHWGPIITRKAQVRPECDELLLDVQHAVDASPMLAAALE
jgi:hypothetical protein